MTATADHGVWEAASTTHTGSSHARTGRPNQDASALDGERSWLVAAVADGHGGSRYVRSEVGSALAVRLAVEVAHELMRGRGVDPAHAVRSLPAVLVPRWRATVLEHHDAHPLTVEEGERAGDIPTDPTVLYGATLLVAVLRGDDVAVTQIGDGSALALGSGTVLRPVPGDSRLVANETTSLCLPTAVDDFRWGQATLGAQHDLVLLATDGYGNSFASEAWEDEVMTDLGVQVREHGFPDVVRAAPAWASESADVGGDDVTLVLVHRRAEAPGGGGRRTAWAGGTTLALGALALTAFVVAQAGDDPAPAGVTSTTTTSTTSTASTSTSTTATPTARRPATRTTPSTVPTADPPPQRPPVTSGTSPTSSGGAVPPEEGSP